MNIIIVILISTFCLIFLSALQQRANFFTDTVASIEENYKNYYLLETIFNYSLSLIKLNKSINQSPQEVIGSLYIDKNQYNYKIKFSKINSNLLIELEVEFNNKHIGAIVSELEILNNKKFKIISYDIK